MTIYNLDNIAFPTASIHAPICIVGAGIAGLLAAWRIARNGQRVIVIESGGENFTEAINQLNEIDDPSGRYTRATTGRYRGLGGTSARWGGRMIPMSAEDASERQHLALPGWSFPLNELDEYDADIEALFRVAAGSHETITPEDKADSFAFPTDDPSMIPRWAKCPSFNNCNLATLLNRELRRSALIEIWLGATVCDFQLDRAAGRLMGLVARNFTGRELRIRSDKFIFAAGSIETTRLLLLLDAASDQRAFERCKVLGRYFQDHLKAEVARISRRDPAATNRLFGYRFVDGTRRELHLELSRAAQERDRVGSAFAYVAMDLAENPLSEFKKIAEGFQRRQFDFRAVGTASRNVGLLARTIWWRFVDKQLFMPESLQLQLMACVEQLPDWNNRISLSETRDRLGNPLARFDWAPTASDELTFRSAVAGIKAYWARAGFDRICPLEWGAAASDASLPIAAQAEACAHPSGSTRMGTDPAESVVGPDLHCHAVPNVAVASASVFPSAGSANPTFTIMKLALWLADSCTRELAAAPRPFRPVIAA